MPSQRISRAAGNVSSVPTGFHRALMCGVMAAAFLAAAASDARASGSISGHLKDAGTNAALVGAQVIFHDFNNDGVLAVATATTDASGNYTQNLPDGSYAVLTHAAGTYINQLWNGLSCSAVCNIGNNGQNITVITISGGNAVVGIDFSLVSGGGGIAGTVTNSAGTPLANVAVFMLDSQNGVPSRAASRMVRATTPLVAPSPGTSSLSR